MDDSASDHGLMSCENGHDICCEEHLVSPEPGYEVPAENCPICSFQIICDEDLSMYLKKRGGRTIAELRESWADVNPMRGNISDGEFVLFALENIEGNLPGIVQEIRGRFASYEEFNAFLREK
jgi:hypothetical protein